jgi:hypothetical protein
MMVMARTELRASNRADIFFSIILKDFFFLSLSSLLNCSLSLTLLLILSFAFSFLQNRKALYFYIGFGL